MATRCSLLQLLWLCVRAVALEAELVGSARPQQVLVVAAMRLVAGRAPLLERGLVQILLSSAVRPGRSGRSGRHSPRPALGTRETCRRADCGSRCNRRCAPGCCTLAFAICSALLGVAGDAKRLRIGAASAPPCRPWRARGRCRKILSANGWWVNFCISFGCGTGADRGTDRQSAVPKGWPWCALIERRIFGIVAVQAKRRRRFGQVIVEFRVARVAGLVGHVAGVAAHVERRVTAAVLRDIDADVMAGQAKVLVLGCSRGRLQQLVLIVGLCAGRGT